MEVIIVGSHVIASHDMYWKLKKEIEKVEDAFARGFIRDSEELDTPFAKSVEKRGVSARVKSSSEELCDMRKAVYLFEQQFPKKF